MFAYGYTRKRLTINMKHDQQIHCDRLHNRNFVVTRKTTTLTPINQFIYFFFSFTTPCQTFVNTLHKSVRRRPRRSGLGNMGWKCVPKWSALAVSELFTIAGRCETVILRNWRFQSMSRSSDSWSGRGSNEFRNHSISIGTFLVHIYFGCAVADRGKRRSWFDISTFRQTMHTTHSSERKWPRINPFCAVMPQKRSSRKWTWVEFSFFLPSTERIIIVMAVITKKCARPKYTSAKYCKWTKIYRRLL